MGGQTVKHLHFHLLGRKFDCMPVKQKGHNYEDFHRMTIAGLERDLPLCKVTDHLQIAAFVILAMLNLPLQVQRSFERVPGFDLSLLRKQSQFRLLMR